MYMGIVSRLDTYLLFNKDETDAAHVLNTHEMQHVFHGDCNVRESNARACH